MIAFGWLLAAAPAPAAWDLVTTIPRIASDEVILDLSFIDAQNGWALTAGIFADHHLYSTVDGGQNWTLVFDDLADLSSGGPKPRLKMFDSNTGYLLPYSSTGAPALYQLSNGGATRTPITLPFNDEVTAFFFLDEPPYQTGWISGNSFPAPLGRIAVTTNGGGDWTTQATPPLPSGTQIHDMFFIDAQRGWACGGRGVILRTEDGGANWNLARVETREVLHAIRFFDATIGWCVGGNGMALYSNNGGLNWYPQDSGIAETLRDIEPFSPKYAIAVAGSAIDGRVISTTTAGAVWNPENIPSEKPLLALERQGDRVWTGGGTTGNGATEHEHLTRTVAPGGIVGNQPFILARELPGATVGINFAFSLEALNGAPPYAWSAATPLPPGLQLNGNTLGGAPQAAGEFAFTMQMTDSASATDQRVFTLNVVAEKLQIIPSTLPNGIHRKKYEEALELIGGVEPLTWRVDGGALPPGVIVDDQGVVAGVPFATGTYQFSVEVSDSNSLPQRANASYTVTIDPLDQSGWEVLHSNNRISKVQAFSESHAIAGGWGGFLYETHSGGRVWKLRDMGWGEISEQAWFGDFGWLYTPVGIAYTEDRGANFALRPLPFGTVERMTFLDALHGWTIGDRVNITTNGGLSWTQVNEPGGAIAMWDAMNGILSNVPKILKRTTDGGHTWTPFEIPGYNSPGSPPADPDDIMGGLFLRGQHGWGLSNDQGHDHRRSMFFTTNLGTDWTRVGESSSSGHFNYVQFLPDNLTGWASGNFNPRITFTKDGGQSWRSVAFNNTAVTGMHILGQNFIDDKKGYAAVNALGRSYQIPPNVIVHVDLEGSIWGSEDGGETYSQQYGWPSDVEKVDENSGIYSYGMYGPTITDAEFLDPLNGYALGANPVNTAFPLQRNSRLYRTNSGGARWDLVGVYPLALNEFAFRNPTSGFAIASGVLLETRDAGETILDRPDITPEGTGVPAGPMLTQWMDVAFSDDLVGWAIALRKTDPGDQVGKRQVVRTTDGGREWAKISEDLSVTAGADWRLFALDRMHLWRYRNSFCRIDASTDGGVVWTPQNPTVVPFSAKITKVVFATPQIGYALIEANQLLTTTNGGTTWEGPVNLGSNRITKDLLMVNCAQGWIGGVADQYVEDLGHSILWPSDLSGEFTTATLALGDHRHEVTRLAAADSNNIYALGSFGLVMKYSGATGNLEITNAHALPEARAGQPYSQALAVINNAPGGLDWDFCQIPLPPGLSLNASGEIIGTPTAAGTFRFTVAVQDAADRVGSKTFTLRIVPETGPTIETDAALPGGDQWVDYATDLVASGTEGPYVWTLDSGILPPGLTLYPWGTIGGVPSTPGDFVFTLRVSDGQPAPGSATREFTLSIQGEFGSGGIPVGEIVNYLLGITSDPEGLDLNGDGVIDAADVVERLN